MIQRILAWLRGWTPAERRAKFQQLIAEFPNHPQARWWKKEATR